MTTRTATTTLEDLRKAISWSPWHYNQLSHPELVPLTDVCNTLVHEYAWQAQDAAGRAELRAALAEAERKLAEQLGYPVGPTWITETHPYTRGPLRLNNGYVQALGTPVDTLLGTVTLTYSDQDGDGLDDTWTATLATTVTDPAQIVVRVPLAQQPIDQRDDQARWTVPNVDITMSGGALTLRGRSWLTVRPMLYEQAGAQSIDPTVAGNFLATLDVFQRTVDSAATVTYQRNGEALTVAPPQAWSIHDARLGVIHAGNPCGILWDTVGCCTQATHMTISYLAGADHADWSTIVARMALAEVAQGICLCETANKAVAYWQYDMSTNQSNPATFQMRVKALDNPFGTRRGHVQAWEAVQKRQLRRGISSVMAAR